MASNPRDQRRTGGLVSRADVEKRLKGRNPRSAGGSNGSTSKLEPSPTDESAAAEPVTASNGHPATAAVNAPVAVIGNDAYEVLLSPVRRRTADNLSRSVHSAVHTLVVTEVDYGPLEPVRVAHSLSYLPFVARAVVEGLRRFPLLNSRYAEDRLVVSRTVNLGFAVDVDFQALLVPVVRHADVLRMNALGRAVAELAERARTKRLMPADLEGGTFTITNVGRYGTVVTAPIINPPQVAILSTDGVKVRPVAVADGAGGWQLGYRPIGNLSMSFDHRAVDGAYAAAFLEAVRDELQSRDWWVEAE